LLYHTIPDIIHIKRYMMTAPNTPPASLGFDIPSSNGMIIYEELVCNRYAMVDKNITPERPKRKIIFTQNNDFVTGMALIGREFGKNGCNSSVSSPLLSSSSA